MQEHAVLILAVELCLCVRVPAGVPVHEAVPRLAVAAGLHLHLRHTILMLMVQKISTILRWTRQRVASWLELEPESIFKVLLRVQLGMEPYADFLFLLVVTTLCAGIVQGVEAQSVLIITNAFLRMLESTTDAKGIVAATARQMGHNSVVKCIGMGIVFGIGRRRETTSTFIKLG